MSKRGLCSCVVGCAAIGLAVWLALAITAAAQAPAVTVKPPKPTSVPASAAKSGEPKLKLPVARDVTLTGRVVNLHCYMTGNYPSEDKAKSTADCIKAGVPAALETPGGLIMLGNGLKSAADKLLPSWAYQEVDVKGKMYMKQGARYLEIASVSKAAKPAVDPSSVPKPLPAAGEATKKR